MSVTYTTAHRNTRSLIQGVRPGVEPVSSWILVRFIPTESRQKFLSMFIHYLIAIAPKSLPIHALILSIIHTHTHTHTHNYRYSSQPKNILKSHSSFIKKAPVVSSPQLLNHSWTHSNPASLPRKSHWTLSHQWSLCSMKKYSSEFAYVANRCSSVLFLVSISTNSWNILCVW